MRMVTPMAPHTAIAFPNHNGHPDGSTRQIGSSARVGATLAWIPTPARSVQLPFGFHTPMTPSTPTPTVIFTPKHHLQMRSPRSALEVVEIAFFQSLSTLFLRSHLDNVQEQQGRWNHSLNPCASEVGPTSHCVPRAGDTFNP
jgi:hypothetical protein